MVMAMVLRGTEETRKTTCKNIAEAEVAEADSICKAQAGGQWVMEGSSEEEPGSR